MGRVIGLETATPLIGVALVSDREVLAEYRLRSDRSRSERIVAMIDQVLREAGSGLKDLSGISVSRGPGSFTGIRVGISTVKGLAFGSGLPVVGVSTLEALALTASGFSPFRLCPAIDAKRGEVYTAAFRLVPDKGLERLAADAVMTHDEWFRTLARDEGPVVCFGSGALLLEGELRAQLGDRAIIATQICYPSPVAVAWLGHRRLLEGQNDGGEIEPVYLSRFQPGPPARGRMHQDR